MGGRAIRARLSCPRLVSTVVWALLASMVAAPEGVLGDPPGPVPLPPPKPPKPKKVEVPRPYVPQDPTEYSPEPPHKTKWYIDPALPSRGTMMCGPACATSVVAYFADSHPSLSSMVKPQNLPYTVEDVTVHIGTHFSVNPWALETGWDTPGVTNFPGCTADNLGAGLTDFLKGQKFANASYQVLSDQNAIMQAVVDHVGDKNTGIILNLEKDEGTTKKWHFVTVCGYEYIEDTKQWKLKIMDPYPYLIWDPNPDWVCLGYQDNKYVLQDIPDEQEIWRVYKAVVIRIPEPTVLALLGGAVPVLVGRRQRPGQVRTADAEPL